MGIERYVWGGALKRGEQEPKIGWGALDIGGTPLGDFWLSSLPGCAAV